jgi:hypothetical protein
MSRGEIKNENVAFEKIKRLFARTVESKRPRQSVCTHSLDGAFQIRKRARGIDKRLPLAGCGVQLLERLLGGRATTVE